MLTRKLPGRITPQRHLKGTRCTSHWLLLQGSTSATCPLQSAQEEKRIIHKTQRPVHPHQTLHLQNQRLVFVTNWLWNPISCKHLDEGPHGEQVGQHGGEALSQAALGDEPKLQLCKANGVISLLPVPAGDVQKMGLQQGDKMKNIM